MELFNKIIDWFFGTALLFNALLFIPQAIRIFKAKSADNISLLTFSGFLLIQFAIVLHGAIHQDYLLTLGYLLSMITCGTVVILVFYDRTRKKPGKEKINHADRCNQPNHLSWKHKIDVQLDCNAKTRESEKLEMLENIIALMPGHVYWVDQQGFYLGCNDNQAKSAGLSSRKEIIGKKNCDLPWNFHTKTLPDALDNINQEVIKTGKTLLLEEPATLRDGTELVFLSHKVPIHNQAGHILGMVGISIDITDRKKIEAELRLEKNKAEAANQAKTEFLQNMRHDIRTALTGIVGLSELLPSQTDRDKIQEFSDILIRSSHELLRFLNEVLDSIQVASGDIPLLNKKFDLREILENIVKLHQPAAIEKQLGLTLEIDEAIPERLIGDPVRIYRIVLELVANALKFTSKGHVSILASLAKQEAQNVVVNPQGSPQILACSMIKLSKKFIGLVDFLKKEDHHPLICLFLEGTGHDIPRREIRPYQRRSLYFKYFR